MFPDPSTVRIIHDTMIADELARQTPDRQGPEHGVTVRRLALRHATARTLIRLADRIAPAPALDPECTVA